MDSFEWNKIAGAVLFALLVAFGLSIFSELVLEPEAPETPGYVIATADSGAQQVTEEEKPIAVLLASADAGAGETSARKCVACHTFGEGEANKVGPNLWGIVMRPIASHEGYEYSEAMHAFAEEAGEWTFEHLNTYLTDPAGTVPQTKMTFAGLKNDSERANVIAYLRTLSDNPEPLPEVTAADEEVPGAEEPVPAEDMQAEAAADEAQAEEAAPAGEPQPTEPQPTEETAPAGEAQPAEEQQGAMEPAAEESTAAAGQAAESAAEAPAMAEAEAQPTDAPAADGQQMAAEAPAAAEQQTAAAETPSTTQESDAPAAEETATAAAEAPAAPAGDVEAGEKFARRCIACHSLDEGGPNKVGPHLFGVFGRPIASVEGFKYSESMIAFSEGGAKTWNAATLDTYLADPRGAVPGAKMIFPGIKEESDRTNLIAYLATLTE